MLVNKIMSVEFIDKIQHPYFLLMVMMVRQSINSILQIFIFNSSDSKPEVSELVDLESWFLRDDILYKHECEHFDENDAKHPR
jgi:hypothetical protein